ncbi:hypothetical protein LEM8419_02262 [Neolewinella maritima]|uniref:PRC-barrel domain containing protein n=1 Tax=Neolewinella maritima TaxID=1383882 RepID=A0ABN8F9Z1_9BACT|nr:hypothetical protein [Neolewinella maritima]CAH1001361.1 hypothetical protein LEM8419_02262 [Neolewinella maritima]
MSGPIFSLATIIGAVVHSVEGSQLAVVTDAIWNKDSGKLTYLIVSPDKVVNPDTTRDPPSAFAIHPSYFYFQGTQQQLVFNPKIGKDTHAFLLDLPQPYDELDVHDAVEFKRYISQHTATATHRSDNE